MTKVTFITDTDETYTVEDEFIRLDHVGINLAIVVFVDESVFPDEIRGTRPSVVQQWDIVVTDDGETVSGSISHAEALTIRFNTAF